MKLEVDNKPELQKYSRRDFMKKTALAAGAMGVAGSIGAGGLGMAKWHLLRRTPMEEPT